jgi:hypothetical protein
MDWYIIHHLYPLAMERFSKTMFPNVGVLSISTLTCYDIRKLYHFFDMQGIVLTVEMITKGRWVYTISIEKGAVVSSCGGLQSTRQAIEIEGFIECFNLLNNIIHKSK